MKGVVDLGFGRFTAESRQFVRLSATMEPAQLRLMREAMRRLRLRRLVDIGANLGLYAVFVGTMPRRPRIEAFEPAAETAATLAANLALNPEVRARVHRLALSDRAGEAAFEPRRRFGPGARIAESGTERVPLARLDDTLPTRGPRDAAVKIDVEGHEAEAISGGAGFLSARAAYVQIESWRPKRRAEVRATMERLGFRYALRVKGDQIFLHESRAGAADALRDVHAKAADEAFSIAGRLAREGRRAMGDPAFREEARGLYNGLDDLAIGDARARLRRALGL